MVDLFYITYITGHYYYYRYQDNILRMMLASLGYALLVIIRHVIACNVLHIHLSWKMYMMSLLTKVVGSDSTFTWN